MHQRKAQRHPGEGQREVVTGSFGNLLGILDFTHRAIVGPQHAKGYPREVDIADERDLMFYTSGPVARALHEPLGAQLSVLLQIYSFSTLISRNAQSVVEITDYSTASVYGS